MRSSRRLLAACLGGAFIMTGAMLGGAKEPMGEEELDRFLAEIHEFGLKNSMWNVRPDDGRFLRIIAASSGAKRVLEIGTSNGYSGIWIARALRETGGKLTTIEIDARRAKMARENFDKAGFAGSIEVIEGDAARVIPTLEGPFDVIFLDTEKHGRGSTPGTTRL
jgi:predicted O-methyltransferase YrrM